MNIHEQGASILLISIEESDAREGLVNTLIKVKVLRKAVKRFLITDPEEVSRSKAYYENQTIQAAARFRRALRRTPAFGVCGLGPAKWAAPDQ
jgi:hypothetical protein